MHARKIFIPDMTAEGTLLAISALSAIVGGASGNPDMASVAGAMFAAFLALMEALGKERSISQRVKIVVGTGGLGSVLPIATHWFCHWKGWFTVPAQDIPWPVWGLAGFFSGAIGWVLAWTLIQMVTDNAGGLVRRGMRKILPSWMIESTPGKPKKK
jgi:hypothetical protein